MEDKSISSLKKRYSYYNKIQNSKGLNEAQQKKFDIIKQQLGDNIPKQRNHNISDEERKENRKKYYETHREHIKEYSRQWNQKNKNKVAEYNKKSYQKRKDKGNVDELVKDIVDKE